MPNLIPFILITLIWGLPTVLTGSIVYNLLQEESKFLVIGFAIFSPLFFALSFVSTAGLISAIAQRKIVSGIFPREPFHKLYFWRRIYGTCWTQVYYFAPIYSMCLAVPLLKKWMLFIFGYKGPSTQFVVYPDSWIRDLPLLSVSKNAYIANKSTIGTNICLNGNKILVEGITIEEDAIVGHLVMLAPGAKLRKGCEIGAGCSVGIRAHIKGGANIKPSCTISHGAIIGEDAEIGMMSHIGTKAFIGPNVKIPAGANIPIGAIINSNEQAEEYHSSETRSLKHYFEKMSQSMHTLNEELNNVI